MDWARSAKTAANSSATDPSGLALAARSARAASSAVCCTALSSADLETLAGLRLQVVEKVRTCDGGGVGLLGDDRTLRREGTVGVGVVALRLPRHLGEPAHEEREHDHHCEEQDDRPGR